LKRDNLTTFAAVVVALIIVLIAAAMIVFFNQSGSDPSADAVISMTGESDDGGEESGTLMTNPNDDGFGTEVSM
jgi:hypothetical protein